MSEKIVAYCGLTCSECPAYIARKTNDNEMRKKAVDAWSSDDFPLTIEEINCEGCISEGELFKHCFVCEVRKCGTEKEVANCAYCTEYPCEKLEGLWNFLQTPQARETLDGIKKTSS